MTLLTITKEEPIHKKMIYLVRHAEAIHNVREKKAVQQAIDDGIHCKAEQEKARKSVLQCPSLKDAPLSAEGTLEVRKRSESLTQLTNSGHERYQPPQIVLVSPLRRALMTATELFLNDDGAQPRPRFIAMEVLREKRTGLACDERSDVKTLQVQFPHVDFTNVQKHEGTVPVGEDNVAVRARARVFLQDCLPYVQEDFVALVSHKGWLRELRHNLKSWVDDGQLQVDFDVDEWHQTLYKNSEIRVAEYGWGEQRQLSSVVSRSVDNAISSIVACAGGQETRER